MTNLREQLGLYAKQIDSYYAQDKEAIQNILRILDGSPSNGQPKSKLTALQHLGVASADSPAAEPQLSRNGNSKTAKVDTALKRPNGVTVPEIAAMTKWKPNTIRGWLSSRKRIGIVIRSRKRPDGKRAYFI